MKRWTATTAVAMGGNGSAAVVWYMSSKTRGGESPGVAEVEAASSPPGGAGAPGRADEHSGRVR